MSRDGFRGEVIEKTSPKKSQISSPFSASVVTKCRNHNSTLGHNNIWTSNSAADISVVHCRFHVKSNIDQSSGFDL